MKRIVLESPLAGDVVRNVRFALFCMRATRLNGLDPIASHLLGPWFLDDGNASERALGMSSEWVWLPDVPHWFFLDLGTSRGMAAAIERCQDARAPIPHETLCLSAYAPDCWAAFERGEWPPHTAGFELRGAT